MAVKICSACGGTERYKDGKCKPCKRKYSLNRYWADPESNKKKALAWKRSNRERARRSTRKHWRKDWKPGEHEKAEAALSVASKCESCGSTDPRHKRGWNADHDHKTGLFRGIVCHPCNIAISHVEKFGLDRGEQIASYLRRFA